MKRFQGGEKTDTRKINNFDNHNSLTIVKKKNTCRCKAVYRQFNQR